MNFRVISWFQFSDLRTGTTKSHETTLINLELKNQQLKFSKSDEGFLKELYKVKREKLYTFPLFTFFTFNLFLRRRRIVWRDRRQDRLLERILRAFFRFGRAVVVLGRRNIVSPVKRKPGHYAADLDTVERFEFE